MTQQLACVRRSIFSASSEERIRRFKASKVHNLKLPFLTKSKRMFVFCRC